MRPLHPAAIRSEASPVAGVPFIDAAGKGCMWPLGGAGADMVVCGKRGRRPYCELHAGMAYAGGGAVRRPRDT
jgi:hypothetical protein